MLGFWRRQSKVLTYILFSLIVFVFIVWGYERRQAGGTSTGAAAQVNNRIVPIRQYRQELQRRVNMYNQMFGGKFDGDIAKQFNLPAQVLRSLIDRELALEGAEKAGIVVSDNEVRDTILKIPVLQKDGRFSHENYDAVLRYNHLTPGQFEEEIRRDAALEKVQRVFGNGSVESPTETEKESRLKSQTRVVEFLKIDPDALASSSQAPAAEVESFLKEEKNRKRVDDYIAAHAEEFKKGERIKARHILIKADAATDAQAQKKLKEVQEKLKTEKFEKVASQFSDDPGSKSKGGDLGWFEHGRMVPEFERVAFAQKIGEIGKPVSTQYGYHIIKVEGKEGEKKTDAAAAQKQVASKLLMREMIEGALNDLEKGLASNPQQALSGFQKKFPNVKWDETGSFSLNDDRIPKIGESDEVTSAAFELSEQKPYASQLFRTQGSRVALKLKSTAGAEAAAKPSKELSSDEKGRGIFMSWIGHLNKDAQIIPNGQLLSQGVDAGGGGGGGGGEE